MRRIHDSPLSGMEQVAIGWFVARMPQWVTPDRLTACGLLGAVIVCVGYVLGAASVHFLWLANLGLVIHWFGDSLDGSIARYRRIERPRYGFFLDQNMDVLGNLLISGGLALSPFVRSETAFFALFGYQSLAIYSLTRMVLDNTFRVTVLQLGPTEIRALLILMNLLILAFGAPVWTIAGVSLTWCDVTVGLFALGFLLAFLYLVIVNAKRMRDEDEKPR
ncbi:MAG: CDP-alcohol phosphatidyltransferase family protein [Beijerinckiaceae bacterium]|nr:CDP-alcohol phosphatidyltransferase family protein [Beijerinckiaceae bacterium]